MNASFMKYENTSSSVVNQGLATSRGGPAHCLPLFQMVLSFSYSVLIVIYFYELLVCFFFFLQCVIGSRFW